MYEEIGIRRDKWIGSFYYYPGIGIGRVVACDIVWGNFARLTIRLRNGSLVCQRYAVSI